MRLSTAGACLFASLAAVAPSRPWAASTSRSTFEVRVASDHAGLVQLFYQLGPEIIEKDSQLQPIEAGKPVLLRFSLPYGTTRALRLDPLDREAHLTLGGTRVADAWGRTLLSFGPGRFRPMNQIQLLEPRGGDLYVETSPGGLDPELGIALDHPIVIPRPSWLWSVAAVFAALMAAVLAVEWALRPEPSPLAARARGLWAAACAHPGRALALAAVASTLAANYPIVFEGRSLVTADIVEGLLYGQQPYMPGVRHVDAASAHGADVGALMWHHVPLSVIESRALFHDGEIPLWNRYDSAGGPLLGQGQSCFGDPLQALPVLAGGASWSWDLKFLLAKWLFAWAVGLCAWASFRHLPSALASAASASFVGFFVYRLNHPAIFSVCYAPWILYCWLRYSASPGRRSAALWLAGLVGACWAEMNSGTVKEAYVLLLMMNLSGLCVLLACARPWAARLALAAGAALSGAVFALLAAPVWLTFLHALRESYTSYSEPVALQLQPGMLIGLFDEAFYRPFQEGLQVADPAANFFVLVGMAWVAVRARAVMGNRVARALALPALLALAMAFGVVPASAITPIPFLGNVAHIDNTFSCALVVILAVLAAAGWREAWERLGTREGRREGALVLALLILAYCAFLGTAQATIRNFYAGRTWGSLITVPAFVRAYAWSLLGASAVVMGALHLALRRRAASSAIVLCAAVALGAFWWREGLRGGGAFADYVVHPSHRLDFQAESPAVEALRARRAEPFRVVGVDNDLHAGWTGVYGLEGISGPDALVNPYYRDLLDACGVPKLWGWRYLLRPADLPRLSRVMDALGVRYYLAYRRGDEPLPRFLRLALSADMDVLESPSAWPRAFFTDSAAVYTELPQFCRWLKAGDGRPFAALEHSDWMALSPTPAVSGNLATRTVTAARDYSLTTNTTTFTVDASGPGFIVLTEAYDGNNFHVAVNGSRARCIRINGAFKGVYVDSAGTYQVSFEYYPRGFATSLWMFAAGVAVGAAALAVCLLPRRVPR